MKRQNISINQGNKQQGVVELKKNYNIDSKTKVLGAGAFGKVYHTKNRHDENF